MRLMRWWAPVAVAVAAVALAACGSSGGGKLGSGQISLNGLADITASPGQQHPGGTLRLTSSEGWQHLDPGEAYFQIDYVALGATQRPLFSYPPNNPSVLTPDLASGPAQISADGKTVTIHIKPNIRWSPPVNRNVTSDDVAYAFERDFNPNIPNAYSHVYYPLVGADKAKGGPIPGISTPNPTTIVFHLTKNFGATFVQSLVLPGSAAVPRELVAPMDKKQPPTYDADPTKQAFDGPYMISKYQEGTRLELVRNPNWNPKTDFRPAYPDKVVWTAGGDAGIDARQTLASTDMLMADNAPGDVLEEAYRSKRDQIGSTPLGDHYVAMNVTVPPFNNVNVRRAVVAAANRQGYVTARGGPLIGQVATHFMGPEIAGFKEAGGLKGPGFDFLRNPNGDMAVAHKYMKLAGYPSGRYTGSQTFNMVGSNADPGPKEMGIIQSGLTALGFKVKILPVPQQTMYTKFCGYPQSKTPLCGTVGWIEDFPDPYAMLYVAFSGKAIVPLNNSNFGVFNDPRVNAAMDAAGKITSPQARKVAWGKVDRLITSLAPAIPEIWDRDSLVKGSSVHGVMDPGNGDWSIPFSSVR